jgi:enterochelin esterase-like enzyme
MNTRQAALFAATLLLPFTSSSCTRSAALVPTTTSTPLDPILTATPGFDPTLAPPPPPTSTAPACEAQPGRIEADSIPGTKPAQEFLIYLPPCYDALADERFPAIYLLHGQTYTQDQWVRLGAASIAERLIQSGESVPFLLIFPDDRYWNLPAGGGFGERLIEQIIPYVDEKYRTLPKREGRSLGGLSRGGGWTALKGFEHPELFNSLGLHSPAIFKDNAPFLEKILEGLPEDSRPRLWLDVGDADRELGSVLLLEQTLTRTTYLHQFHLFSGDHTEAYWSAHLDEYLRWYAQGWGDSAVP